MFTWAQNMVEFKYIEFDSLPDPLVGGFLPIIGSF
jgi:hypothetical protein